MQDTSCEDDGLVATWLGGIATSVLTGTVSPSYRTALVGRATTVSIITLCSYLSLQPYVSSSKSCPQGLVTRGLQVGCHLRELIS